MKSTHQGLDRLPSPDKTQAELWRRRLLYSQSSLSDVKRWTAELIMVSESQYEWLIDVSTASSELDAVSALLAVPGVPDMAVVWRDIMDGWANMLAVAPESALHIAKQLFASAQEDDLPDPSASSEMWGFWDDVSLADDRIYGSPSEVRARLMEFLVRWSSTRATNTLDY